MELEVSPGDRHVNWIDVSGDIEQCKNRLVLRGKANNPM